MYTVTVSPSKVTDTVKSLTSAFGFVRRRIEQGFVNRVRAEVGAVVPTHLDGEGLTERRCGVVDLHVKAALGDVLDMRVVQSGPMMPWLPTVRTG